MAAIEPKNITAQLHYRARGNPPASHPELAVGNFFPGLEFNFQNVWKRIFIGLELLEYGGQVIAVHVDEVAKSGGDVVSQGADKKPLEELVGAFLETVDGQAMYREVQGPRPDGAKDAPGEQIYLEWSNALARIHAEKGGTDQTVECWFVLGTPSTGQDGKRCTCDVRYGPFRLKARRLIEPQSALISREASLPGEITESLCSPWQTDYIGCACYYWAANRPDFVNLTEVTASDGAKTVTGHNWLNVGRATDGDGNPLYSLQRSNVLRHEDVMQGWEHKFQFVIKGNDAPDGLVAAKKSGDDA
jgi:hypothetical protein